MRKRQKPQMQENHERWLLTYADLITLLLAFFIVMYSMSRIDAKKFGAMSTALSGVLSGKDLRLREQAIFANNNGGGAGPLDTGQLRVMQNDVEKRLKNAGLNGSVETEMTGRGFVIHILEGALFETASADLTDGARAVLRVVGRQISDASNHIRVEGHTDPRPIHNARFPSNWELSTARATSVLRFLVDSTGVNPANISALGFGEFRPRVPNDSPEQMAQNRRVDIVVLAEEMNASEPMKLEPTVSEPAANPPTANTTAEESPATP